MDITEQLLSSPCQWDDYPASPNEFFSHVEDSVIAQLLEQEELSSYTAANEKNALSCCATSAKYGQFGYVVTGIWLDRLRQWKHLWQRKAKTFNLFCQQLIGRGSWYASQIIKAAKVCLELIKQDFKVLPTCEAQARPLTKYLTENDPILGDVCSEEMFDKWQEVIDTAPPKKGITSDHVRVIVDGEENTKKTLKTDSKTYERLAKNALEAGMSKEEYLNYLLDKESAPEPETEEEAQPEIEEVKAKKTQIWLEDLETLVDEFTALTFGFPRSTKNTRVDVNAESG